MKLLNYSSLLINYNCFIIHNSKAILIIHFIVVISNYNTSQYINIIPIDLFEGNILIRLVFVSLLALCIYDRLTRASRVLKVPTIIRIGTFNLEVGLNLYNYEDEIKGDISFPWNRKCMSATPNKEKISLLNETIKTSRCDVIGMQEVAINKDNEPLPDELICEYYFGSLYTSHPSTWNRAVKKGGEKASLANGLLLKNGLKSSNPRRIDISSPCVENYTRSAALLDVHYPERTITHASVHKSGGFMDDSKIISLVINANLTAEENEEIRKAFANEKHYQTRQLLKHMPHIICMDGNAKLWNFDPTAIEAFNNYKKQIIDTLTKNNNLCTTLSEDEIDNILNRFLCINHPDVEDSIYNIYIKAGYRLATRIEDVQHSVKFGGIVDLIWYLPNVVEETEEPAQIINEKIVMKGDDPYKKTAYLSDHNLIVKSFRIKEKTSMDYFKDFINYFK